MMTLMIRYKFSFLNDFQEPPGVSYNDALALGAGDALPGALVPARRVILPGV